MLWTGRRKFIALMILHLLWGSFLWFSISKYGLGVSTDAVHMLFGGLNFISGNGLTAYDGTFLVLWPPLYPILLGVMHWVGGWEMLAAAGVLQVVTFLALSICSAMLFLKIFPEDFALAALATVVANIGSVVLIGFGEVGSDYIHLFLVVLFTLLTGQYLATRSARTFVMLAVVVMLAALTRYLGVATMAAGAASIILLARDNMRRRISHSIILCLTAAPTMIWLAITSQLYTRRDPITLTENFNWFSRSILEWFFAGEIGRRELAQYIPWLWVIILLLIAVVLISSENPRGGSSESSARENLSPADNPKLYLYPLLLYGAFYAFALFGSASLAYFNKLGGRFLLPLYLPLVSLPIAAAAGAKGWIRHIGSQAVRLAISSGLTFGLLAMTLLLLRVTLPLVVESHTNGATGGGNSLNTRAWRENAAVGYWLSHTPSGSYILLSNEPDGAAFHTQHAADPAPRRATGPYATEELPLSIYAHQLFVSGKDVYLLWIEPSPYDYYYAPEELEEIAAVKPLTVADDGGVYRLVPRMVP